VSKRTLWFAVLCVAMAALCVRLGFWQLGRLGERRARNAVVRARLDLPVVALSALPADSAAVRFRRAETRGRYDYAREVKLAGRSRNGSPGVHIVTPLRVDGAGDTVVLVNRGWVYSPDAASATLERWRERDTATVRGFVDVFPAPGPGAARAASDPRAYRWLDRDEMARVVGAPVAPVVLVAQGDTAGTAANRTPVRLGPPPLDEGPHWNYAVQWFAFAGVSIAGLATVVTAERRKARAPRG
jgi:surfeit locus 1 family protein